MKSTCLQLFMDWDIALKHAEDKDREVDHLCLDLGGLHPSSCTATSQAYMVGNTHVQMEDPHVKPVHEEN